MASVFTQESASAGLSSPWDATIRRLLAGIGRLQASSVAMVKGTIAAESEWMEDPPVRDTPPSYGLMQVSLGAARSLGFRGTGDDLRRGEVNLAWGIPFLYRARDFRGFALTRDGDRSAAYNAGSVMVNPSGQYVNTKGDIKVQSYVDTVLAYRDWYAIHDPGLAPSPDAHAIPGSAPSPSPGCLSVAAAALPAGILVWWLLR